MRAGPLADILDRMAIALRDVTDIALLQSLGLAAAASPWTTPMQRPQRACNGRQGPAAHSKPSQAQLNGY
jgi:hypothetical protein